MNEIALSNNLSQIELEISHHKQIAGQSIWEIGRRLNHVKEHNLVHGEFMDWYTNLGIDKDFASKSMKIAKELPNFETLRNLGTTALHLIATLPEEEREEQIQRIEDGETPTVRELQEVKMKLKLSQQANQLLRDENEKIKSSKVEVKVNVTNMDQFNDLVKEFNKKAHELEELAHELNKFRFEADILPNGSN